MEELKNGLVGYVRDALVDDMPIIFEWLELHKEMQGEAGFLNNWDLTKDQFNNGNLLVFVEAESGSPIAYQWGKLKAPGILEVRHDHRGSGVGKAIVEHCIEMAINSNQCILHIECKPYSSIPFWEKMGFTLFSGSDTPRLDRKAYMVLPKHFGIPDYVKPHELETINIKFYPYSFDWNKSTLPYQTFEVQGWRERGCKTVRLEERVSFVPPDGDAHDCMAEVSLGNDAIFSGKPSRHDGQTIGFVSQNHGFYIDSIG